MYRSTRLVQSRGSDEAILTMACPLCGDRCTCSYAPSARASAPSSLTYEPDEYCDLESQAQPIIRSEEEDAGILASATAEAAEESFAERPPLPPEDIALESAREEQEPGALWKQELASRLESYRARRGSRRPRYNATMSLDFDRAANRMLAAAAAQEEAMWEQQAAAVIEERNEYFGSSAMSEESAHAIVEESGSAEATPQTNIIEFPRLPTLFDMAPTGSEIADPVIDKPRILYVPEEVPTAQAPLADIQLEPEEPAAIGDLELPMAVAPMSQRVLASIADAFLVLIGSAMFMVVVLYQVPAPEGKLGYAMVATLPAVLWAIYEYLFLVHCAHTPGMQLAHLALVSFDSEPIGRRARRERALAWMLSSFPLGLGVIWALLDEDTLCWHDRITRTYMTDVSRRD